MRLGTSPINQTPTGYESRTTVQDGAGKEMKETTTTQPD